MNPILLQVVPTLERSDTTSIIIGILIIAAFFILLMVAGNKGGGGGSSSGGNKGFSKRKFKKIASSKGLTKGEINYLESMIKQYRISSPYQLLANSSTLDSTLRKALYSVEESAMAEAEKDAKKLSLYRIKQKVERTSGGKKGPHSTRDLRIGQELAIAVNDTQYNSKLTSNLQKSLGIQVPRDDHGNEIRWRKWTKVKIFFWRKNGQGFSFDSKIVGYNVVRGISSLFLQHTNSIQEAKQRKYRRKELERPAYFYPVKIVTSGSGKEKKRKAVVENNRGTLGTILEVSAGGCSVRASYPLGKGELIKVEFETERGNHVTAFGKIRAMKRQGPKGGVMHIMFTRLSRQNLNAINSFVYDLEKTAATPRPRL